VIRRGALALVLLSVAWAPGAEPIGLDPANPHYYRWNGKPVVLVTSAEHYGAVVNAAFDYVAYLDSLAAFGLNYTRIYPGYLIEPVNKWIGGNTLGPRPDSLLVPWARSRTPGSALGGNRFDLDAWDPAFFARLADFIAQADRRGIAVEICFFNCQYEDCWPISPLFHRNNVQGTGTCDSNGAQTLEADPELARREEAYVRRIVEEVNRFDNVILEVCDEPILNGTPPAAAGRWISRVVDAIRETEAALPKRHLIAQQIEGALGGPCDFSADPRVPVIVTQYVWSADGDQLGGMQALHTEYIHGKPLELNETAYYPIWYRGDPVAASRAEAWEFIVGGGAAYNHLNGIYTVVNPGGASPVTGENDRVRRALQSLMAFMNSFDFVRMAPLEEARVRGSPRDAFLRCLAEQGRQYAAYLHHSTGGRTAAYTAVPGRYAETVEMDSVPAGTYRIQWIDPAGGREISAEHLDHPGGTLALESPGHSFDIALRITRQP
jgi:hypothetical protein